MTYMWPKYFSLGRLGCMSHGYDLYLYKEGQHSFSDARKVHLLSCSTEATTRFNTNYSNTVHTDFQMPHCQRILGGQCCSCMEVMVATSRYGQALP